MKYTVLILSFCFSLRSVCQGNSIETYYYYIDRAEKFIIENNLDSSSIYFSLALKEKEFPFSRHVYNASIVDAKLKKYKNVLNDLTYLIKLGYSYNKIRSDTVFQDFFGNEYGRKLSQIYRKVKPIYNFQYRKEIEILVRDDQYFRKKEGSYSLYGDTIRKIDKRNIDKLLALIKTLGFPSEARVGIDSNSVANPLYFPIVIHQSNGSQQQFNFSDILKNNIKNGNIENKAGEFMINRSDGNNFFQLTRVQYVRNINSLDTANNIIESSSWGYYPLSNERSAPINRQRKELYLDSYEDNLSKLLFNLKFVEYKLSAFGAKSTLNYAKYEDYISETAGLKFN
jgi:hypothetical protein